MAEQLATVLLVDVSSGRAAAAAEAYANDPEVGKIICISRSDQTLLQQLCQGKRVDLFPKLKPTSVNNIVRLAQYENVNLVDILQDRSVAAGLANRLREHNIPTLGPNRGPGRLESDKTFARRFMARNGIPIPKFLVFDVAEEAQGYLDCLPDQTALVIKANGLADGKGVVVAPDIATAKNAVNWITNLPNNAGSRFLLEEKVGGPNAREFSAFYLGHNYDGDQKFADLGFARDYKTIGNGGKGDNTGGMGTVSYPEVVDRALQDRIRQQVINPTSQGLMRLNMPYIGVLYLGGMYDPDTDQLSVIEFNARMGDPEGQVLLPNIGRNNKFYSQAVIAAEGGKLKDNAIRFDNKTRISIAGCAQGYPRDYSNVTGRELEGVSEVLRQGRVQLYGAGIVEQDGRYYAKGGRIVHIGAEAPNLKTALVEAYEAIQQIHIRGDHGEDLFYYRTDIGS